MATHASKITQEQHDQIIDMIRALRHSPAAYYAEYEKLAAKAAAYNEAEKQGGK